jgi:hypothetical protein
MAPMIGKKNTCSSTESDTIYGKKASARIAIPSGWTKPSLSAAARVTEVRYGPKKTETTVVEKAEFAQS